MGAGFGIYVEKKVIMKRIPTLLLLVAVLTAGAQNHIKVLFLGNSYTYVNDLPGTLKTLSQGCGDTLTYEQSTPGSCTFQQHLSNATSTTLVNAGGWDYVVLQEQSQLPSFPISQVESQCFPYAQQLCEMVRAADADADVVFYMTWGRKNGDASNCANYPPLCTYEGMDSLLYWRYMQMAEDNHAIVSPVGRVWHVLRDSHPEIELYSSDGSHPSVAGTYAAAVTFYTVLFRKSPSCISNDLTLGAAAAQAIRETVAMVVFDSIDYWTQYDESAPEDPDGIGAAGMAAQLRVYPNPASGLLRIELPDDGGYEITLHNAVGAEVSRIHTEGRSSAELSVSDMPSGIYILQCRPKGGNRDGLVRRTKVVVE